MEDIKDFLRIAITAHRIDRHDIRNRAIEKAMEVAISRYSPAPANYTKETVEQFKKQRAEKDRFNEKF